MKPCILFFLLLICSVSLFAQGDTETGSKKFQRDHMFLGTGLNLSLASSSFSVGLNPELGYSLTKWLDAGIAANINYLSQNASDFSNYRYRNFNYGGGAFLRIWPVSFLHFQVQPEYNWIILNQKNVATNQTGTYHNNAGSLLVGVGYGTHLIGSAYSYITLMMDVLQNANSPYRDQFNDPLPVFRAGFGFYFKPKSRK
ncbi:MAG TPA: hypothetical protein VG842_04295 [Sediminibacterium sp.]|nr:hypothetical protein [Sediminibacterium sp.]